MKIILKVIAVLLILISGYGLYNSYAKLEDIASTKSKIDNCELLSTLSLELAKEKGLSALYLLSKGEVAKQALLEERVKVNESMKEFYKHYEKDNVEPNVKNTISLLTKIGDIRHSIDTFAIDFNAMFFDYYSQINTYLFKELKTINDASKISTIANSSYALVSLYKNIEYLGQERGFVAKFLSSGSPFSANDLGVWMALISNADIFDISMIEDAPLRAKIENLVRTKEYMRLDHEIAKARAGLILMSHSGEFPTPTPFWFELLGEKIDTLFSISKLFKQTMLDEVSDFEKELLEDVIAQIAIVILSFILIFISFRAESAPKIKECSTKAEKSPICPSADLILLKQSKLESKLFMSVLEKMCTVEVANDYCELKHKMKSTHYKMVMVDHDMLLEDNNTFVDWVKEIEILQGVGKIHTVLFVAADSSQNISAFDTTLPNQMNKDRLEALVKSI